MTQPSIQTPASRYLSVAEFPAPVKCSWLRAWLVARGAVRAGVPMERFLESRIGGREGKRPSFWVAKVPTLVAARPTLVANPEPDPMGVVLVAEESTGAATEPVENDITQALSWIRASNKAEAAEFESELRPLVQEAEQLKQALSEANEEVVAHTTSMNDAIEAGEVLPAATLARSAESRGRPVLGISWGYVAFYAFLLVGVVAELNQYVMPLLNWYGVQLSESQSILDVPPATLVQVLSIALMPAVIVFLISKNLVEVAFPGKLTRTEHRWGLLVTGALVAAGLIVVMVMLRHGQSVDSASAEAALQGGFSSDGLSLAFFVIFGFAVPVGAALLRVVLLRSIDEKRAAIREGQAAFDAAERDALAHHERLSALRQGVISKRGQIETKLNACLEKHRALRERIKTAEAELRRKHESELAYGATWSQSVLAALHLLAYEFERQARKMGRVDLLDPTPTATDAFKASGLHRIPVETPNPERRVG